MGIKYIDAKRLRRVLIGGGKWIQKHETYLNDLNVYPVPDGDTGSNMSLTAKAMIEEIENHTDNKTSMNELVELVEEAVLIGARGNSGTILSQIITGFLKSVEGKKRLVPSDVAEALQASKELAYKVVNTPVEGTMLTVIRRIAERAEEIKDCEYFDEFIEKLVETADEAVQSTPELLPKLKEAGVVDSGGMGLYYFFVGMGKVLIEIELLTNASIVETEFTRTILNIDHNSEDIKFKYCTEFIILNGDFDVEGLKKKLLELGDSAVFAKSTKKFKTHIHTNHPGEVIELAASIGDLEKIKIENMKLQNEGVIENEKDMAKIFVNNKLRVERNKVYVILADTPELKDEFLKLGADIVVLGGQSKNPSVNDMLNAINKVTEDKSIYILPNNKNVISTSKLVAEKSDKPVIVVPTKTMMEGMFYLQYPNDSLVRNNERNSFNHYIEITKAVRDTTTEGMDIQTDDYLLLVDTKIKYANKDIDKLFDKIISEYVNENTLAITLVEGINKHLELTKRMVDLKGNFTVETKVVETSMENYDYYISIENKDPNLPEIAVVTDSASDLTAKETEGLPLKVIPIRMDANGVTYIDGVNVETDDFWKMMIDKKMLFKTSRPSPKELANIYQELFRKGYKKIFVTPLSGQLSGTLQGMKVARDMVPRAKDIYIYDSKAISILQGFMAREAAIKSKKGQSIEDIVAHLDSIISKCKLFIVIDSLEYLERGGRISKTAKTVGDFLNLKPIISINNGVLEIEKKVFGGETAAIKYVDKYIADKSKTQSMYLVTGFGGTNKQLDNAKEIMNNFKNNRKVTIVPNVRQIGPTVGTHAGPVFGSLIIPKLL